MLKSEIITILIFFSYFVFYFYLRKSLEKVFVSLELS